jgi:hypothetical protein
MDINQFFSGIVEDIVVAVPQLLILLTSILYNLNLVKKNVSRFPEETQKLGINFGKQMKESFSDSTEQIGGILKKATNDMALLVSETKEEIAAAVNDTLENMSASLLGMANELKTYQRELSGTKEQVNELVMQNYTLTKLLVSVVFGDEKSVSAEITKKVQTHYKNLKANLNYDKKMLDEHKMERVMSDAVSVLGRDEVQKILNGVDGHERHAKIIEKKQAI